MERKEGRGMPKAQAPASGDGEGSHRKEGTRRFLSSFRSDMGAPKPENADAPFY